MRNEQVEFRTRNILYGSDSYNENHPWTVDWMQQLIIHIDFQKDFENLDSFPKNN